MIDYECLGYLQINFTSYVLPPHYKEFDKQNADKVSMVLYARPNHSLHFTFNTPFSTPEDDPITRMSQNMIAHPFQTNIGVCCAKNPRHSEFIACPYAMRKSK